MIKKLSIFIVFLLLGFQVSHTYESKDDSQNNLHLVDFQFEKRDLKDILNEFAQLRGINILYSSTNKLNAKVTFDAGKKITFMKAWEFLLMMLEQAGFSLVNQGKDMYNLVGSDIVGTTSLPIYINVDVDELPVTQERIRYIYYFKNISLASQQNDIAAVLKNFFDSKSMNQQLVFDQNFNAMILATKSEMIKAIMKIVNIFDQAYTSLLLVDFGIDAIRILYIQKGVLKSVRLVPYGLSVMMKKTGEILEPLSDQSLDDILQQDRQANDDEKQHKIVQQLIVDFYKQVTLSISFFQKQIKDFIIPAKIVCLGVGTELPGFLDNAVDKCQIPVENLDIKRIAHRNNIQINKRVKIDALYSASLINSLSAAHYGDVNFLSNKQKQIHSRLLNRQLFTALLISIAIFVGLYFYSNYQSTQWDNAYEKSKKEMVNILKDQMDIDVKKMKRVSEIVSAAQNKLQQAKNVCRSYSQSKNTFLNSLQELSSKIDRESLGLDLKKLSLHDKEVVLQGKVKDFDALETFEEELMELPNFTIKNIPGELAFTVTLQAKEDQDKN